MLCQREGAVVNRAAAKEPVVKDLAERLRQGLQALGLSLDAATQQRLLDYLALLTQWGAVYNLTAVRDPEQALIQHLLDALSIVAPLRQRLDLTAGWVADVGSGAGVPGLILAMVEPRLRLLSVEPVGKKAAFQRQVCAELALTHVEVSAARVEQLERSCNLVLCRAFASIPDFVTAAGRLVAPTTTLAAMKAQGREIHAELAQLGSNYTTEVVPLRVPMLDAERHLVLIRPQPSCAV